MNEQDLFQAIGSAEDVFLAEIEDTKFRHLPPRATLIAAVLIIILLTACAAPMVLRSFDKIVGGQPAENGNGVHLYILRSGSSKPESVEFCPTDVEIEVTADPNAPKTIEEYRIPLALLDYCNVESYTAEESVFTIQLSMNVPHGRTYGIFYRQYAIPPERVITVPDALRNGYFWEQALTTYADVSVLEFSSTSGDLEDRNGASIPSGGTKAPRLYIRNLFWSDGFYLYCLRIPQCYPITEVSDIENIITSLTTVDDLSAYLPPQ